MTVLNAFYTSPVEEVTVGGIPSKRPTILSSVSSLTVSVMKYKSDYSEALIEVRQPSQDKKDEIEAVIGVTEKTSNWARDNAGDYPN